MSPPVAVVDVGSNSIKVLVAALDDKGRIGSVLSRTIDARISAGISEEVPRLSEAGMETGVAAIKQLLAEARPLAPVRVQLVATSAVRDAANGAEFARRVQAETGCELRILGGDEEAAGIGRGLAADPALASLENFYVFDLGGGSLECLGFADRAVQQALSLPLGCVRLTEKFITDPSAPIRPVACNRVMAHVRTALAEAGFRFDLPDATAVATGGTAATARAIYSVRAGAAGESLASLLTVRQLREQLEQACAVPIEQRRLIPGLPALRADVYPAALATLIAIAETGGLNSFRHSFYNLRYGLAAELLETV